jgi:hypothetical protein
MDIQRRVLYGCDCPTCQQQPDGATAEEHRDINRLVAACDERGRRLLVGFLARQRGRGGIALLARVTGLSPHTIRKGQRELRRPDSAPPGRVRRPGGGRRRVEKKRPRW